jgi:type I restriction enzyme S subunit
MTDGLSTSALPITFSNFVKRLRVIPEIDPEYFALGWRSLYYRGRTRPYEKRTTGIRNFKLDDFLSSETLPLPNPDTQRRVVQTLSTIERAGVATESELQACEMARLSLMTFLFEPAAIWPTYRIDELAKTSSGGTPRRGVDGLYGGSIPWVKSGEVRDGPISETEESITEDGLASSSAKLLPAGTLLMAMYGATAGQVGVLQISAATNQAICAIHPRGDVSSPFLYFALQEARRRLRAERYGGAQPNLSQQTIRNFELAVPDPSEQRRIAKALEAFDVKVRALRRKQSAIRGCFESALDSLIQGGERT